jgi:DNA polymerase III subunit epsilon
MRVIALDTETTGASPARGDRAVEIGLVEMIDGRRTGRDWRAYFNPRHPVHWAARRVHGLSDRFLADKPLFAAHANEILDFIDGAPCLAHNARFDRDVILHEFHASGLAVPALVFHDTIPIARGALAAPSYSLDALVTHLRLETPDRRLHGALLDASILGQVLETIEARKPGHLARHLASHPPLASRPPFLKAARFAQDVPASENEDPSP